MINTPPELYPSIIEHFISAHAEPTPNDPREVKFIPRGYLTPLLRVSKQWYADSIKHLYRSIAVGSHTRLPGKEIAKALHRTLKANPELAALVERLQLGIQFELSLKGEGEWTKWNVDILQLCPNVAHVQIQGYQNPAFDALLRVLEEKSLVSFSISSRCLSMDNVPLGGRTSKIFNLMQHWPKLRSFQMQGGVGDSYLPRDSGCCPDLREIEITNVNLDPYSCRALRMMCSGGVTKFSIWSEEIFHTHELIECLRAWSATLEYLRAVDLFNSFHGSHLPLTEAISTLTELRVLELNGLVVDCGIISNLPRLERVYIYNGLRWELGEREEHVQQLSTFLKNSEKFPSLTHIAGDFARGLDPAVTNEFLNICRGRDIQLGYDYPAFQTLLTPTHRSWSI